VKNTPLPAVGRHVFRTRPGQRNCSIVICDGESTDPQDCAVIGKVVVDGLPAEGAEPWLVQVRLVCRPDGKLEVDATVHDPHEHTRVVQRAKTTIVPTHGMSEDEIRGGRDWLDDTDVI
jgi:molecular chaperone DnaK (HSP70)